jgi:acyl-CoA thioester hydrolase
MTGKNLTLVHCTRMPIRWGDMDAMGHVNNTVYFRYIEQARIEWFSEIGCQPDPLGEGPVIVNAHCSFLRQLKYPGDIEVRTFTGTPGRSSFETTCEIRLIEAAGATGGDGAPSQTVYAEAGAKVVWVHFPSEKSAPLPQWLRDLLLAGAVESA